MVYNHTYNVKLKIYLFHLQIFSAAPLKKWTGQKKTDTCLRQVFQLKVGGAWGWLNEAAMFYWVRWLGWWYLLQKTSSSAIFPKTILWKQKITHLDSNDIFLQILTSQFSTLCYSWNQMFFKFNCIIFKILIFQPTSC